MTLPGLIDPHVHLRTPGQTEKEDFFTGTSAAIAGGFTTIVDMPNNVVPITTRAKLTEKREIAKKQIICDVGFHIGSLGENLDTLPDIQDSVLGLKIYLNQTTGNYIVNADVFKKICATWPNKKPILVHAEEDVLQSIINIAHEARQQLHICHVSSMRELELIKEAKEKGHNISCGVTPHHLFLTQDDEKALGGFGKMKPNLKTKSDQDFLWKNLQYIDIVESDHAPHTLLEKQSITPPFGVPGLETTLPLLLTAMNEGRITLVDIIRLCHNNAAKIFNIKTNDSTFIEIDEKEEWTIKNENLFTKCKWSPFNSWEIKGRVKTVTIRGTKVFEDNKILVTPGFGKIIN